MEQKRGGRLVQDSKHQPTYITTSFHRRISVQVLHDEMRILKLVAFSGFGVSPLSSNVFETIKSNHNYRRAFAFENYHVWLVSKISYLTE